MTKDKENPKLKTPLSQSGLSDLLWQKPEKATLKGTTFAHQNPELFEEHYNSRPLACPNCKGTGKASKPPCTVGGHCLNCKGAGVVWR